MRGHPSVRTQGHAHLCNLECVISDRGKPWSRTPKVFHCRSDAKNVVVLQQARIEGVSVANNHTLDFETEAMLGMLRLLDLAGIHHTGARASLAEASRAAHVQVNGTRLGVLAFPNNKREWAAGEHTPGLLYVPLRMADRRAIELYELVRQTKSEVDFLIVSAYWGPNWGYAPLNMGRLLEHSLTQEPI